MGAVDPDPVSLPRWIAAIGELTLAVNAQEPLEALLHQIAATACDLLGYESAAVLLTDPDRTVLRIEGSSGLSAEYLNQVNIEAPLGLTAGAPFADSPSRRAFDETVPILVDDIAADPTYGPWADAARTSGHRSMASVPLVSRSQVMGTVNVYGTRPRQLGVAGLQLLQVLASHAGIALETSSLLVRERARSDELRTLYDDLRVQQGQLLRQAETHDRLMSVVREGGGLTATAAALAEMNEAPVVVTDLSGRAQTSIPYGGLMIEVPVGLDQDQSATTRARGDDDSGGRDPRSATATEAETDIEVLDRASGVARTRSGVHGAGLVVVPVIVGDERLGSVWTAETVLQHDLRLRALEQAAVVIGQDLLRRRASDDAQWQLRGDLLSEILNGGYGDPQPIVARGDRMGADLRLPHLLLALQVGESGAPAARLDRAIRSHLDLHPQPKALLTRRSSALVLALPASDPAHAEESAHLLRSRVAASLGTDVRASMSEPVPLQLIPAALRQVTGLLRLVSPSPSEPVLKIANAGLAGFVLADLDPATTSMLAERWVAPLRDYDEQHGASLLDTVRAYTDHHQNTAATAVTLFVHPNTVNLRLKRIESVLDASLANLDHLTALRAALLIDDVRRSLD